MCTKKQVVIFLAGAEAFHTFAHVMMIFIGLLPMRVFGLTFTHQLNILAITLNAIITIGLLYWASLLKK